MKLCVIVAVSVIAIGADSWTRISPVSIIQTGLSRVTLFVSILSSGL